MFNMATYQRERYAERMSLAKELLGGKCVKCGSTEELQIDHINPSTKEFTVSSGTLFSIDRFLTELKSANYYA